MKKLVALIIAVSLVLPVAAIGTAQPQPKTVAVASLTETDANLSITLRDVVDTFVEGSIENGEAILAGEKVSFDMGNDVLNIIIDLLCFVKQGALNPVIYAVPVEGEDYCGFRVAYSDCFGAAHDEPINAFYSGDTGEIFGEPYDSGVFGLGFNYNAKDKVFFAVNGCWQREFGFMSAFDIAASLIGYDYTTRRICFEYGGKEWMIQIWKGNYHWEIFVGGETGIYNRVAGEGFADHYNCVADDEMVPMSMKIYDENEQYIDRPSNLTWWMTGFKFAGHAADKEALTLETTYTFPNAEMCSAFARAAQAMDGIDCAVDGLTAHITW